MLFFPLLLLHSISITDSFRKDLPNDSEINILIPNSESELNKKARTKVPTAIQETSCGTSVVCKYDTLTDELIVEGTGATQSKCPNENVKSAIICENITSISSSFFYRCTKLTNVTLPSTLQSIGNDAFYLCTKLKNLTLPIGLLELGTDSFALSGITSIVIPIGVTRIPSSCFAYCYMKSITFHENLLSIDSAAFKKNEFVSIHIPSSVQTIGSGAFTVSPFLTAITVDSNNQYFKQIDNVLFTKNGSILIQYPALKPNTTFIVPDTVESISGLAFYQTKELKHVECPSSLRIISTSAFEYSSIQTISLKEGLLQILDSAFHNSALTSILIPSTVQLIGSLCFYQCDSLASIDVEPANQFYISVDHVLYNKNESILITFPPSKNVVNYSVQSSVTEILSYAVSYSKYLKNVFLPFGVKKIGQSAFRYSSLNHINIPNSTTKFGSSVFYSSKLIDILIPNNIETIPDDAFCHCTSLINVTLLEGISAIESRSFYSCTKLPSIVIPESVTVIGPSAFSSCTSLTSLTISIGVTTIESYAFSSCQSLPTVFIPSNVNSLQNNCFANCKSLRQLNLSEGITTLGDSCFSQCSKLPKVTIPTTISTISSNCFYSCSSLTSVTIPNSITTIKTSSFEKCTSLPFVEIPSSVTSIGTKAFYGCTALTEISVSSLNTIYISIDGVLFSITSNSLMVYPSNKSTVSYSIPNGIIQVEQYAFSNCRYLNTISIPNSTNKFSSNSFELCSKLANCYYYGISDPQVKDTFYRCPLIKVVYVTPKYLLDQFCYINVTIFYPRTPEPSEFFTESLSFTNSLQFTKSNTFTRTSVFTNSMYFTKSDEFSKSNSFYIITPSSPFSKSLIFSPSTQFTKSLTFSSSNQFTKSLTFSSSTQFTKSDEFSKSDSFFIITPSSKFSKSLIFSSSNQFTKSLTFSSSTQFTKSDEFSKSDSFFIITPSSKFSKSLIFSSSTQFTGSDTLNMKYSSPFSQSSYFSSQIDLATSEPISISHLETFTPTKSLPQQTAVIYVQSSINEETYSSDQIGSDENAENMNKDSQKSNTNIGIIVGVVVGTVAVSAAVIIGVLCCKPIGIVPVANEEDETYPFDSNAGIDTESTSSEEYPLFLYDESMNQIVDPTFQDDELMNQIIDPADFENDVNYDPPYIENNIFL